MIAIPGYFSVTDLFSLLQNTLTVRTCRKECNSNTPFGYCHHCAWFRLWSLDHLLSWTCSPPFYRQSSKKGAPQEKSLMVHPLFTLLLQINTVNISRRTLLFLLPLFDFLMMSRKEYFWYLVLLSLVFKHLWSCVDILITYPFFFERLIRTKNPRNLT